MEDLMVFTDLYVENRLHPTVRVWFDKLTMIGEKTVRPELVEGCPYRHSVTSLVLRT